MAFYDRMNQNIPQGNPLGLRGRQLQQFNQVNQPPSQFGPRNAYDQAIPEQASNYDEIMQGYRGMMGPGNDGGYGDVNSRFQRELDDAGPYEDVNYSEAPEFGESYAKLREYANTGGLSEQEVGNLRARAISPIRAVYANMQRNMERQRSLGGGQSPNYNAVASRMARESSEQIAQQATNANASIAEMQQKGRLAMAPEAANMASGKNSLMNEVALANAKNKIAHSANKGDLLANYSKSVSDKNRRQSDALQGMTSLYGTNPALVETFGNQVARNRSQLENETEGRAIRRSRPRQITSGAPRSAGM
jgi:hypothetical protein